MNFLTNHSYLKYALENYGHDCNDHCVNWLVVWPKMVSYISESFLIDITARTRRAQQVISRQRR